VLSGGAVRSNTRPSTIGASNSRQSNGTSHARGGSSSMQEEDDVDDEEDEEEEEDADADANAEAMSD
jgi:hypothetical protein